MRLALVNDKSKGSVTVTLADENGDGIDDDTGEPVEVIEEIIDVEPEDGTHIMPDGSIMDDDEMEYGADTVRWLLAVEGTPTGDGREFERDSLTWRELPLPLMATDETSHGHDGAKLVANIVSIERDGDEIYGVSEMIYSEDERVEALQQLIVDGHLRGVSVDLDNIEGRMEFMAPEEEMVTTDADGNEIVSMPLGGERMIFTAGRIMGATAVPFPAFAEAQQVSASLTAAAGSVMTKQDEPSLIVPPDNPPVAWMANPNLAGPTPLTVGEDGRVSGHLALFDSCHIGFQDRCVQPPRSASEYAAFHSGALVTAEGETVRVGQITVDCGHAALRANAEKASEHYDHTGWAAADVRCGEDAFGIWIAGAMRPGLTANAVRAFMGADVSGDWRAIKGNLELVGIASVNVPGFSKAQFSQGDRVSLVASVPICTDVQREPGYDDIAERIASTVGLARWQIDAERDRLALSVGVHPAQRRLALLRQVQREAF
tara:strand:+ start:2381 stop:3844 length:1464 start_codon:yes stop_codon:yes gene_type:complete